MKNKPLRHKEDNTFKFQPFAERIANIDVDIFHRVAHPNEEVDAEELECVFYQTIQKWNVLNLSESYSEFCKEVYGIITLPQLLHKKEHVVEVLVRHIKLKNPLSLQPLLDLVVAFAKDLRKEFYPYYTIFLNAIIDLLNTKDTDQLEWTFTCLAYLFKFLWRYLVKDIGDVFNSLLPLLSSTRPPYINNFAAESFSFVARKVKDRESFLSLIIEAVQNKHDGISGCGKLLFEVIRGVSGQFHSCANTTLSFYFDSLSNENLPQDVYYEILQQIIYNLVQNIHAKNMELYWKTLLVSIDKNIERYQANKSEKHSKNLELLLKLISLTLEYKSGRMLNSYDGLVKHYLKMIAIESLPENVLFELSKIGSLLLISTHIQLSQENASLMIRKTLQLENKNIILDFIDKLTGYSSFEPLILPVFLKYFGNSLDPNAFKILTKLVLKKSPLAQNGIKLSEWKKYPLEFTNNSSKVISHLFELIKMKDIKKIEGNMNDFISALICLPHVNSLDVCSTINILEKNIHIVFNEMKTCDSDDIKRKQKLLFILSIIVENTIYLSDSNKMKEINDNEKLIDVLMNVATESTSYTICSLRILDMIISSIEDTEFISLENLNKLNEKLVEYFSSPLHQVRLLVAHIYSLFDKITEFNIKGEGEDPEKEEKWNVFTICYKTEAIEPLVHTYRDQLQLLQKLSYDKPQSLKVQQTDFIAIPLRYFLGCLYMNFQLIWEPVVQLIEGYAHGMRVEQFWPVFSKELKDCVEHIRQKDDIDGNCGLTTDVFIYELGENAFKVDNKPDFVNYRTLLWKAMAAFADIAETKSRDTSVLMLDFIENEYRANNVSEALSWNIKQTTDDSIAIDDTVVEDDNDHEKEKEKENENEIEKEEDENAAIKKELNKSVGATGKTNLKTLLMTLNVFTKMRSPKSMYREPELYKIYLDLLSHRNSEVQKTALDCIMVYKHKYLTPYKDHLYSLIDDKKFKNELALFRINKETTVVQEEHRKELIPIVLRIVHSKMMAKTGLRTGGKSSGQLRRSLVLRFLAGCHEEELMKFIHMSFKFYANYIKDNPQEIVNSIIENVNLEKFIPPKRLQSTLNLLLVVLEQFGGLMGQQLLNYLLKILLVIGAAIVGAMKQKQNIHVGYLASLRNIRTTCQTILGRFFAHFETYVWTNSEINAIFDVFIWPWLDKLTTEGIHSPTALLKLFHQWGLNPRYFILFVKRDEQTNQYVLPQIIKLLRAPKVHPSVTNTILEIIEKLLSLKVDEEETTPPIEVDETVPIAENILERLKINDELNYGSCILLPFVPDILDKFKKKLANKNKGVNQRELFIMSRISELVWEPETCDIVLTLVLPMVVRKATLGASDETILQLVQTVYNLIKMVHEPHKHLRKIAPLFGEVSSTQTRKLLCEILQTISKTEVGEDLSEKLKLTFNVIKELNAFDKKWLDQADFDRRHKAFKHVNELITSDSIHFELGAIIIYNCFYFIRHENDLALRESSTQCLRALVPYLAKKFDKAANEKDYLFNEILFQVIRKGFKSKNPHFRHESISLLGHMARECAESNTILRDLSTFANKQDMEVDFFENLLHLQLYRQTRGLNRFNSIAKELLKPLNPRTLTQFILPLISSYLLNDKFSSKNSLMDATIECVKIICQMLPWHHYESILKYYLGQLRYKLEFQKQLVKLTVAILDAYHFDLSKGKTNEKEETIETVVEKKVEEPKEDEDDETEKTDETEKDIDEILEDETEAEVIEEEPVKTPEVPAVLRQTILCPSGAKRVIFSIKTILLPQLHKAMAEMTSHEGSHKINRKRTGFEREEEELQKVPISLAVVKLLQKLPTYILERNLPGVFMKTCTFLKSHLESVRRVTREILQKIMGTLGPKYLGLLISEMSTLLSRGFQVHVLVYTIHAILVSLKETFQPTDIDKCLLTILDVCKIDLFGNVADEKEVSKIITKTSEAKATKSFDTFQILAQFITEKCLMDLIIPLKETLTHSHSFKIVNKVQECLRRIVLGLVDNTFIPVETLIVFAYGTSSESIPQFMSHEKPKLTEAELEKKSREKPDCFIIPKPPTYKSGNRLNHVRNSKNTNAHLLVEFGLRLCYFVLKRDKVQVSDYLKYIDPFVGVFKNCLTSRHVKMCTLTIQCLSWVMKYDLPSMEDNIQEITILIFELLHKYAAAGLSKGDNFDLVVAAFKAMAILVRDVKYYTVTTDQLKALLLYAEQDLHDYDRQATAFALLKSIITRKLIIPEIHDVMDKVAELSITSDLSHVRLQSRQVFHQFLMDYPLGKKLDTHLAFYMSQLNYELQPGRESALEMINGIIHSFPMKVLKQQAGMFFVMLGARLINDESPECRKMVAKCLENLLERLEKVDRNILFDIVKSWFQDKKINHRRLAAQLCGLIITVEKSNFTSRLPELTPIIKYQLCPKLADETPGKFVRINASKNLVYNNNDNDEHIKPRDHQLFQLLQMMLKLCANCPSFLNQTEDIEVISQYVQTLLGYPHEWVRISAAQFIGFVLSKLKIDHLSDLLVNKKCDEHGYLYSDPENTIKSLSLDLCAQLQPGHVKTEMAEQIIKNLVFLARVLEKVPIVAQISNENLEDDMDDNPKTIVNLFWLTKRMRKIVNREVVEAPKSTLVRTEVFKWIAGIVTLIDAEKIKQILHHLLAPIVRELGTTEQSNAELRQLAKEVGNLLKKKVGTELYISTMSKLQTLLNVRRAERKRERVQMAVTNPDIAAKKKIKLQEKKKDAKKRKLEMIKGKKPFKKRKKAVEIDE